MSASGTIASDKVRIVSPKESCGARAEHVPLFPPLILFYFCFSGLYILSVSYSYRYYTPVIMIHSNSDTTSPTPTSPFSSYSVPSEPTSDGTVIAYFI